MTNLINSKISDLGLEIAGGRGDGCFYFVDLQTDSALNAPSVMVSAMKHLTLNQWRAEALYALEEHLESLTYNH